jgi:hypothetical protein
MSRTLAPQAHTIGAHATLPTPQDPICEANLQEAVRMAILALGHSPAVTSPHL